MLKPGLRLQSNLFARGVSLGSIQVLSSQASLPGLTSVTCRLNSNNKCAGGAACMCLIQKLPTAALLPAERTGLHQGSHPCSGHSHASRPYGQHASMRLMRPALCGSLLSQWALHRQRLSVWFTGWCHAVPMPLLPHQTVQAARPMTLSAGSSSNTGKIVGIIVGVVAAVVLCMLILVMVLLLRRRRLATQAAQQAAPKQVCCMAEKGVMHLIQAAVQLQPGHSKWKDMHSG